MGITEEDCWSTHQVRPCVSFWWKGSKRFIYVFLFCFYKTKQKRIIFMTFQNTSFFLNYFNFCLFGVNTGCRWFCCFLSFCSKWHTCTCTFTPQTQYVDPIHLNTTASFCCVLSRCSSFTYGQVCIVLQCGQAAEA